MTREREAIDSEKEWKEMNIEREGDKRKVVEGRENVRVMGIEGVNSKRKVVGIRREMEGDDKSEGQRGRGKVWINK